MCKKQRNEAGITSPVHTIIIAKPKNRRPRNRRENLVCVSLSPFITGRCVDVGLEQGADA